MSIKRYKPEQIVTLLRQIEVEIAHSKTTPQACKEAKITQQTYYRWRKEYGGPEAGSSETSEGTREGKHSVQAAGDGVVAGEAVLSFQGNLQTDTQGRTLMIVGRN